MFINKKVACLNQWKRKHLYYCKAWKGHEGCVEPCTQGDIRRCKDAKKIAK